MYLFIYKYLNNMCVYSVLAVVLQLPCLYMFYEPLITDLSSVNGTTLSASFLNLHAYEVYECIEITSLGVSWTSKTLVLTK